MKNRTVAVVLCIAGLLALCVSPMRRQKQNKTQTQPKPAASQTSAGDQNSQMANTLPGAPHNALAKLAGEYTTATKASFSRRTAPDSTGEAKLRMTLDGRFLAEDDSGNFMDSRPGVSR